MAFWSSPGLTYHSSEIKEFL